MHTIFKIKIKKSTILGLLINISKSYKPNAFLKRGFTLAELLIALAILGIIATFTIPKVLYGQQKAQWNATAKETAAMISGAYSMYLLNNQLDTTTFNTTELTQYMNYAYLDSTSTIDGHPGQGTRSCSTWGCLKLHNGGILRYGALFCNGNPQSVFFSFDPDGESLGGGAGESIEFRLYKNGLLRTLATVEVNTCGGINNPNPAFDPSWFSW